MIVKYALWSRMRQIVRLLFLLFICSVMLGLLLPNQYTVTQAITIEQRVSKVAPLLHDLTQWHLWSPWPIYDNTRETQLSSKTTGVGAYKQWYNKDGRGELTLTDVSPSEIRYTSIFNNQTTIGRFIIATENSKTHIIWSLSGYNNTPVIGGYLSYISQFKLEQSMLLGLRNLKSLIETTKVINDNTAVNNDN